MTSWLYSRRLAPWLLLAPALILGFIFYIAPIGFATGMSLTDWNGLSAAHWRGLANYAFLAADGPFLHSLLITVVLSFGSALIGVPAALLLALAVAGGQHRAAWRTIFWLPAITNVVAVAYGWQFVLDPTYGVVNRALGFIGISGPQWLTSPPTAMLSVAAAMAWITLGHNMLLFTTGLEAIDPSVIEAANSDGATERQVFWYVTLPLLAPTTLFVLISTLITGMGSFALILVMTEGGPEKATTVAALFMYKLAFESLRLGRAAAAAIILAAVTLLLSYLQFRWFGRDRSVAG